jgi:hypothetical protein
MRHPSTKELFDYWNLRRGDRAAPDRADIDPGAIRRILADTFILTFDEAAGHPFRIAGTRICVAFGRELKNERFLDLWDAPSRKEMRNLVQVVGNEVIGALANVRGTSATGTTHEAELLLLPITYRGFAKARVLGALTPRDSTAWLTDCAVQSLTLRGFRYLAPHLEAATAVAPAQPTGRIRHGFVVYDGGRTPDAFKI